MNKPLQKELWEKIQNFSFDNPTSDFPFSKKLQQENNWTTAFTNQAILEYRKFIFLCCILPGGASPSDTVDKVWHLHLTYTTNYWVDFCRETLHKDIHHFPSKGGEEESSKHRKWYQQTLERYQEVFGMQPPASIWPAVAETVKPVIINIYEKSFYKKTTIAFLVFTIGLVVIANIFRSKGEDFLLYYGILMIAGFVVSRILQQHKSARLRHYITGEFPGNFSPYQIADFLYGKHRAYQTALVDLLKRGVIDVEGKGYKLTEPPVTDAKDENPLLPSLTELVSTGQHFSYREGLVFIDEDKLRQASFDQLTRLSKLTDYQKFFVPGIVLVIGFARLFQGMAHEKPVGFLVLEIGVFSLISLMIAANYSYTQLVSTQAARIWKQQVNNGHSNNILNNFTVLGITALAGFAEYQVLTNVFAFEAPERKWASDASISATSSCSSGGDSGGCGGGCGGCGGGD